MPTNVLFFPGVDGDNFGTDIDLPNDELDKVVHLETVAVHPAFWSRLPEGCKLKMFLDRMETELNVSERF